MDQILLTRDGYEKLEEECARLRAERDRAAEDEHLDSQQELELIERRLGALERRLADAEIVAARRDGIVEIGEAVSVLDLESGEVAEYRIVGTGEPDPPADAVTSRSPVGRALLGRGEGDVVEVDAPGGRLRLEILALDG